MLEQGSQSADFWAVFCRRSVSTKETKGIKHMQKEGTGSQPSWTEAPAQKIQPEDNPEPRRTQIPSLYDWLAFHPQHSDKVLVVKNNYKQHHQRMFPVIQ